MRRRRAQQPNWLLLIFSVGGLLACFYFDAHGIWWWLAGTYAAYFVDNMKAALYDGWSRRGGE